jgi:2-deoxy-D-gluconate 3-dehydrogenase
MPFPSLRVDGLAALVTGAGSGIGRTLALGLAENGADVALTELPDRLAAAQEAADEIASATGRRAVAVPLDVRDVASIGPAVDGAAARLGRLDVLVNNAGVQRAKPAFDVTEEDWDFVVDVDLKGVFFVAQAAARVMLVGGRGGRIVNIASINGLVGYYDRAPYCAAKGGVVNLTRQLAVEWASHAINVNAIAPTYIMTPLAEQTLSRPEVREDILRRIPLGRIGQLEDLVGAVVYLASPAASLVTGQTLAVDGGWTAI